MDARLLMIQTLNCVLAVIIFITKMTDIARSAHPAVQDVEIILYVICV